MGAVGHPWDRQVKVSTRPRGGGRDLNLQVGVCLEQQLTPQSVVLAEVSSVGNTSKHQLDLFPEVAVTDDQKRTI